MGIFIILLLIVALIVVFVIALQRGLVTLRNKVDEAWSDISTQLKRRYDLIPNLVETVKGYASHESTTLEKVVQARSMAMNAQNVKDQEQAENMLTDALKSIFALAESYPDLKANQNFLDLQKTLTEIEEHIQLSRRYYNATVRDFNTKIQVFPNNLIAGPLGFTQREYFQATDEEKQNVKVDFSKPGNSSSPSPNSGNTPQTPESPQAQQTQAASNTGATPATPTPAPTPADSTPNPQNQNQPSQPEAQPQPTEPPTPSPQAEEPKQQPPQPPQNPQA